MIYVCAATYFGEATVYDNHPPTPIVLPGFDDLAEDDSSGPIQDDTRNDDYSTIATCTCCDCYNQTTIDMKGSLLVRMIFDIVHQKRL